MEPRGRNGFQGSAVPEQRPSPDRERLVTSIVRDLVAGSGIEFEDRGEHELKGVPGAWRIFLVTSG
jgi:class 3 adenylate cyclase